MQCHIYSRNRDISYDRFRSLMSQGLRHRLRTATEATHHQVEAAFSLMDLAEQGGLRATLHAHDRAISRLLPSLASVPELHGEAMRLHGLARQSLAASGGESAEEEPQEQLLHPLAVAYVLLGSRLGSRVISADLERRGATLDSGEYAYFTDDNSRSSWKALLRLLDASEDCVDRLTADAIGAFDVFASEARLAAETMEGNTPCQST